jgi:hypothetical protein
MSDERPVGVLGKRNPGMPGSYMPGWGGNARELCTIAPRPGYLDRDV